MIKNTKTPFTVTLLLNRVTLLMVPIHQFCGPASRNWWILFLALHLSYHLCTKILTAFIKFVKCRAILSFREFFYSLGFTIRDLLWFFQHSFLCRTFSTSFPEAGCQQFPWNCYEDCSILLSWWYQSSREAYCFFYFRWDFQINRTLFSDHSVTAMNFCYSFYWCCPLGLAVMSSFCFFGTDARNHPKACLRTLSI